MSEKKKNLENAGMIGSINSKSQQKSGGPSLSGVPLAIILSIVALIVFALFYMMLSRQNAQKHPKKNKEEIVLTQEENPNAPNIGSMISLLNDEAHRIEKTEDKIEDKFDLYDKFIPKEEITPPEPPPSFKLPPPPPPKAPSIEKIEMPKMIDPYELERQELRRQAKFKALNSTTKSNLNFEQNSKNGSQQNANHGNQYSQNDEDYNYNAYSQNNSNLQLNNKQNNINDQNAIDESFLSKNREGQYLEYRKVKPKSDYEIQAGWIIPAILQTGVNSELSGQVTAIISQNVYNSTTGEYLLIPQGTRVVGTYSSNVIYGQTRLLIAWNRLLFPNGDSLNIGNMQGISKDGYTGFNDQVNNHYARIFGSALLLSSITAGIAIYDNSGNTETETASDKAISATIQQMGGVASEMIKKNLNIAPTLMIRQGYKFNIFVNKDMILEPIKNNFYRR